MQVPIYWISEAFLGLLLITISFVLVNYTRRRVAGLPIDERAAGRPLYLSAVGIFFLGIGSVILHLSVTVFITINLVAIYYIVLMISATFLTLAALMILGKRKLYPVPIVLLVIGLGVSLGVLLLSLPEFLLYVIPGVLVDILFYIPAALFFYLTYKTRRSTSMAFAFALTVYPLYPVFLVIESYFFLTIFFLALRLFSTGLLFVALLRPEIGISGEFWGYSAAGTVVTVWISYLISSGAATLSLYIIALTLLAAGTAIGLATASYTYGRYTRSKNRATLLLSCFFIFCAFGFLLPTIEELNPLGDVTYVYIYLSVGMLSMMLLNIGAFLALDWKSWSLAPVIIGLPAFVYIWLFYPQNPDFTIGKGVIMGITLFIQTIIPFLLYIRLGYRIRKAGGKGYLRPTFLSLGIIFLILGSYSGNTASIESAIPIFLAFLLWAMGVTGWADRAAGTA